MDCILDAEIEFARLDGRPVSAAFHLAQIQSALQFILERLPEGAGGHEIREACADVLEALAALNARRAI